MTFHWTCVVLVLVGHLYGAIALPPTISVTPTANLRSYVDSDSTVQFIGVTDPQGLGYSCTIVTQSLPFHAHLDSARNGYLLTLSHSNKAALTLSAYTVEVECTNDDMESNTADVIVTISDNGPPVADTNLTETVTVDVDQKYLALTVLHTVAATDPEGDTVTCTATSVSADFAVDPNDCTIRNVKDLRSLPLTSAEVIEIDVSDGINPPVAFRRTLSFINQNRPPEFTPPPSSPVQRHEDVTSSDVLVTFHVTDDQPFSLTFSVDTGASLFDFDGTTGEVTLASGQSLDYETGPRTFKMECVANDGFFQTTSTVTLSVLNVNDAPTLTPHSASVTVPEGAPSSMAATLSFTVADEDDTVDATSHTFSVVPGGAFSDYFVFSDVHVPVLTNLKELDKEGNPPSPLTLKVAVSDSGGKSATAEVEVTVTDVNDNDPVFVTSSLEMSSVYLGMPSGTVLGKVRANDADEGLNQDVEFSLVTPNPHPGLYNVQADGTISLLQDLTQAYGTALSLEVKATDRGTPPKSSTAVIVLDWNKPPGFTNLPSVAAVPRDPPMEKLLLIPTATDPENDPVTFSVTDVTPSVADASTFVVKPVPGTSDLGVYYSGVEHLTSSTSYDVTVTAMDGKGGSSEAVLTVQVTPNVPPVSSCHGSESAEVDVTAPVNGEVETLTVTDANDDNIEYVVTSVPDTGSFRFDSGSKKVVVNRNLRLEAETAHKMTITISDTHNPALTCTLYITITNINVAPVFADHLQTVPVDEHVTAMTSLFKFDITDTEGFSVRWEVDPSVDSGFFTFDDATHEIKVASGQSFDYETKTTKFIIKCIADDGFLQSTSTVTISILDSNDPPYFVKSSVTTSADEGPAGTVSFLPDYGAVDPDGDALTYSIVAGGTYSDYFSIDTTDGKLTNRVTLDRDGALPDEVSIQVEVSDPSGEIITTDVNIVLNDINDNTPIFNEDRYVFKVGLSTSPGTVLGTLDVSDLDDEDNGEVGAEITAQTPAGYMALQKDGDQFHLVLARNLDVDYGTLFSLEVTATDNGNPARFSTVNVDVIWNEGPKIMNLPDTKSLAENLEGQQPIFDLEVIDLESDQYTCVLDEVDPSTDLFSVIDTGNKNFKVYFMGSGSLDASAVSEYVLTVRCYDINGQMSRDLTVLVQPNSAPVLTCSPSTSITVDAIATGQGDTVYTVRANDLQNDHLEYGLTSSFFDVGTLSGVVKAKRALRSMTTDQFSLSISVDDGELTADCILNIFLTNVNKAPTFNNLDSTVDVPENTVPGSVIYVVDVNDPNIFEADIDVTWTSSHDFKFEVDVSALKVTIRLAPGQELDYESSRDRTITLTFEASDGYLTSDDGTLTIRVTPVNEPPYFDGNNPHYYATFNEYSDPAEVNALGCNVIDPDDDDEVTLTLTGPNADLFSITDLDNCQMTLISEYDLDGGAPKEVTLTLTATDKLGETAEASVTVTVEPINDNTPEFEGPVLLLVEYGSVGGDIIGQVVATDPDIGSDGVLFYEIATDPLNAEAADKYLTFSSTGEFILKQSMDDLESSLNFQYVIRVSDDGDPVRTATTTVNVVYDPFITTTPEYNVTSTTPIIQPDETSLLEEPLVIGLLVALACIAALLVALGVFLCCRHCGLCESVSCCRCCKPRPTSSTTNSLYPSRPNTPVRSNKISVVTVPNESSYAAPPPVITTTAYEGRKISALLPLPLPQY